MRVTTLARRVGRAVVTVPVAFTVVFLSLSFVSNPNAAPRFNYVPQTPSLGVSRSPRFAARDESLVALYTEWFGRVATLDLGVTPGAGRSVVSLLVEALGFTAVYFLPAFLLAVFVGTAVQLYAVSTADRLDCWTRVAAIVAVSVPVFVVAFLARTVFIVPASQLLNVPVLEFHFDPARGPLSAQNLRMMSLPFVAMTLYLTAIQMRYAGNGFAEYTDQSFVKLARAKGAGPLRVGRHILPHTVVRLATTLLSDTLGLVLVGVYVLEWLAGVPGFGALTIDAIGTQVPGLMFATVLLPVTVAVVVNLGQDLYYALLDPRVDAGSGVGE
ncbi:MAG: ABC-type dipeptide/oligopeptide/nickel transport system, permease component [halophilic archaeon J07HB67]|nr:MAG: ABC-type dipeptide/oligopeptide/nickel transport system, permease component [halophilic archaeon J07HB67]